MTRLKTEWIVEIEQKLPDYDAFLVSLTGKSLMGIAAETCGIEQGVLKERIESSQIKVVPITAGLGTIDSFSDTVAAILRSLGAAASVTDGTDVKGLMEAVRSGADVVFMADDDRYIALNIRSGRLSDNNEATPKGYVKALKEAAGGLDEEKVLLLGCGVIGENALSALEDEGAIVHVYDKNPDRAKELVAKSVRAALLEQADFPPFRYIFDATNEGGWLQADQLREDVLIAAPGVPLSLDEEAQKLFQSRVIHDDLEIGTAVMLAEALCGE